MDKKNAATFVSLSDTNVSPFRTGLWRKSTPIFENRIAPCTDLCPCGENIPAWMHLLSEGMIEDAWRECTKENPFPLICGRVCYRFCEAKCNREGIDDKLSINAAERFLGEWAVTHGLRPALPANGKGGGHRVLVQCFPLTVKEADFRSRSWAADRPDYRRHIACGAKDLRSPFTTSANISGECSGTEYPNTGFPKCFWSGNLMP